MCARIIFIFLLSVPLALDGYRDVSFDLDLNGLTTSEDGVPTEERSQSAVEDEKTAVQDATDMDMNAELRHDESYAVSIQPGHVGIDYDSMTGAITDVFKGSQAERLGIHPGDVMLKINGEPFSEGVFAKVSYQNKPFEIRIWALSFGERLARWTGCLADTAISLLVTFRLVRARFSEPELQGGRVVLACVGSTPVLLLVLASSLSQMVMCYESLLHHAWVSIMMSLLRMVFTCSLAVGARGLCNSPLAQPIQSGDTQVAERLFSGMSIGHWMIRLFAAAYQLKIHEWELARALPSLSFGEESEPNQLSHWFYLYGVVWGYARVAEACSARIRQVSDVLPCDKDRFDEKVGNPIAELVHDLPPVLAHVGMPLLLMCSGLVWDSAELASYTVYLQEGFFENLYWASRIVGIAILTAIAITTAPFGISYALEEVTSKLAEARIRDPKMHLPIHAVETMLAQANHGRGFGIPVGKICVFTKEFLQTTLWRIATAAVVLATVAKQLLGYETAEGAMVAAIADVKTNTGLILASMNASHNVSNLR